MCSGVLPSFFSFGLGLGRPLTGPPSSPASFPSPPNREQRSLEQSIVPLSFYQLTSLRFRTTSNASLFPHLTEWNNRLWSSSRPETRKIPRKRKKWSTSFSNSAKIVCGAVCSLQTLHLVRTQSLLQDQGLRLAEAQCPSVGHNILIQIDNCALKYFRGVGITDKECSCMLQIIQIGRDSIQSLFSVYQEWEQLFNWGMFQMQQMCLLSRFAHM